MRAAPAALLLAFAVAAPAAAKTAAPTVFDCRFSALCATPEDACAVAPARGFLRLDDGAASGARLILNTPDAPAPVSFRFTFRKQRGALLLSTPMEDARGWVEQVSLLIEPGGAAAFSRLVPGRAELRRGTCRPSGPAGKDVE